MLLFGPKNDVTSKKKKKEKVFSEISTVFPAEIKLFACDFDGPITSQCHLDGPPKLHGPRGHCPPLPPLS